MAVKQYVETNQNVLKWLMNNSLLREILSQLTHKWWVDSVGAWSGVGDRLGLWQPTSDEWIVSEHDQAWVTD
jgi:hypothetical protein